VSGQRARRSRARAAGPLQPRQLVRVRERAAWQRLQEEQWAGGRSGEGEVRLRHRLSAQQEGAVHARAVQLAAYARRGQAGAGGVVQGREGDAAEQQGSNSCHCCRLH